MCDRLLVSAAVFVILLNAAAASEAGTLSDDFSSNPFASGSERWCERWHDVSWNSNTGRVEAIGDNDCDAEVSPLVGHSCCEDTNCHEPDQGFCSTAVTSNPSDPNDPSAIGLAGALITELSQESVTTGNTRSVEVLFNLAAHLAYGTGDHVAVFPVGHPNCHAGFEATIRPDETFGAPYYRLQIVRVDGEPPAPHDEDEEFDVCGNLSGSAVSLLTGVFTLSTSAIPRYRVEVSSQPYPPIPGYLAVGAAIYDTSTNPDTHLGAVGYATPMPAWYDIEARRYVIGGQFESTLSGPAVFDDFLGEAGPGGDGVLYVSFTSDTTVPGVGTVADEDIVAYDEATYTWSLYFDGSDVGAGSDLNAFHIRENGSILMSFDSSQSNFPDIEATLDESNIVLFTPTQTGPDTAGTFSLHFDGSDVGLTTSSEDIDAIYETDPNDVLQISTSGNPSVPGVDGDDEDILEFTPTDLGDDTAGTWAMFCDASDCGFGDNSYEDINGISWHEGDLMFTTVGDYNASGGSGEDEDVSTLTATFPNPALGIAALHFDLTTLGISNSEEVDGISYRIAEP